MLRDKGPACDDLVKLDAGVCVRPLLGALCERLDFVSDGETIVVGKVVVREGGYGSI